MRRLTRHPAPPRCRKTARGCFARAGEGGMATVVLLSLFFSVLAATRAAAAHVVIVKASDAEPYTQAETSIRTRLAEVKHEARTVLLKEVAEKGIAAII